MTSSGSISAGSDVVMSGGNMAGRDIVMMNVFIESRCHFISRETPEGSLGHGTPCPYNFHFHLTPVKKDPKLSF
jgi:hypothetical protein